LSRRGELRPFASLDSRDEQDNVGRASDMCIQISDSSPGRADAAQRQLIARCEVQRLQVQAAVISQLRIPSLTPSQFPRDHRRFPQGIRTAVTQLSVTVESLTLAHANTFSGFNFALSTPPTVSK
jgi:hypothetical protein